MFVHFITRPDPAAHAARCGAAGLTFCADGPLYSYNLSCIRCVQLWGAGAVNSEIVVFREEKVPQKKECSSLFQKEGRMSDL